MIQRREIRMSNSRGLVKILTVLTSILVVSLWIVASGCTETQRPPNIILIMADDLGYNELGCYGQQKIKTPNIDRLAEKGMRFTQFYSGSPVCAPSRCVLMTGKHTGHSFIRDNSEVGSWESFQGQLPIPAGTKTLAEILKEILSLHLFFIFYL